MICEKLPEIFGQEPGVGEWWTPGKVGSVGKVNFHTNDLAQTFLRDQSSCGTTGIVRRTKFCSSKGSRYCAPVLWGGILTHGAEMGIDGDWERGRVWFKQPRTEERTVTIYRRTNSTSTELAYTEEIVSGRNARVFICSWNVAQLPAEPLLTKGGAVSKQAKGLHNFCAIWGETIIGRSHACKNSPRRVEKSSLRRLRATGCWRRLHARGNDVWRSWSQRRLRGWWHFLCEREEHRS